MLTLKWNCGVLKLIIFGDKKFTKPLRIIKAFNNTEFIKAFQEIENLKNDYYIAGYIRYEAKNIFLNNKIQSEFPLLYFEVFDNLFNFGIFTHLTRMS